jgi:hypothetical protein
MCFGQSQRLLRFLFYLPLHGFCIDMPEASLRTGRNMWVHVRVTSWIKINLFRVKLKKYSLFIHTLYYLQLPYTLSSNQLILMGIIQKIILTKCSL